MIVSYEGIADTHIKLIHLLILSYKNHFQSSQNFDELNKIVNIIDFP